MCTYVLLLYTVSKFDWPDKYRQKNYFRHELNGILCVTCIDIEKIVCTIRYGMI